MSGKEHDDGLDASFIISLSLIHISEPTSRS